MKHQPHGGLALPEKFRTTVLARWGKKGEEWLQDFPALLQKCEERFSVSIGNPRENSYNFVADAKTESSESVIVKIGYPGSEFPREIDALEAFREKKMVRMLDYDRDLPAIVLQKLAPGTELATLPNDEEATRILGEFIRNLPVAIPKKYSFPTIEDWLRVIDRIGTDHPIPPPLLSTAQKLHEELDATKKENKLLHGDLHHYNIIFDKKDGWVAIDPQCVIGDPIFEAGRMLHNPANVLESGNPQEKMQRRVAILGEELDCDRERIIGWAFVDCVIAACWSVEDHKDGWKGAVECAQILESFL